MADTMDRLSGWFNFINSLAPRRQTSDVGTPVEQATDLLQLENAFLEGQLKKRELEGPGPREKLAFDQYKWQQEQAVAQEKSVISRFAELWKGASPASKKLLGEQMQTYWSQMSPAGKQESALVAKYTPLNPDIQKAEIYKQMFPPPDSVSAADNYDIKAKKAFMAADWEREFKHNMGFKGVTEVPTTIALGEGVWGYRGENGIVQVLDEKDLELEEIAKAYNTTKAAIMLNSGKVPTSPERIVDLGTSKVLIRSMKDVFSGEDSFQSTEFPYQKPGEKEEVPKIRALPDEVQKLFMNLGTRTGKDFKNFKTLFDSEGDKGIARYIGDILEPSFPGWKFGFQGKPTKGHWYSWFTPNNYYIEDDDWRLHAWPYTRVIPFKDGALYYDEPYNMAYDGDGNALGTLGEALSRLLQQGLITEEELGVGGTE